MNADEAFQQELEQQQLESEESMSKIAPAFIKAKQAFAPALKKATNPHFGNKYVDLAKCIDAVDDAFLANGIVLYQEITSDDTGVLVETILLHESGETIRSGKLHVPAVRKDPQAFMSASTYGRRYSLMATCGIAPEDDDGNAASVKAVEQPKASPELLAKAKAAASLGVPAYKAFWQSITDADRKAIGEARHADFKTLASEVEPEKAAA